MDKAEASELLNAHLAGYRHRSYAELRSLVGVPPTVTQDIGPSGTPYQLEIEVFWDAGPDGAVRVRGAIHDAGMRAFAPLTRDFLVGPDARVSG